MTQDERIQVLKEENRRLERAAANRLSGFADADLRALIACLQVAAEDVGDITAVEADASYAKSVERPRRSTAVGHHDRPVFAATQAILQP